MNFQSDTSNTISKAGSGSRTGQNTFVGKLLSLISDPQNTPLIHWSAEGTSFIVVNASTFSEVILPNHFKHNNFSSFIRQLNMYGFHKTNRTPRGQRGDSEHQSWEFSHPMFIRDRPELAASIKRSLTDQESLTKSISTDFQTNLNMMQSAQNELATQVQNLRRDHNRLVMELAEAKKYQAAQQQVINNLLNSTQAKAYLDHQIHSNPTPGNTLMVPTELNQPSICITPANEVPNSYPNLMLDMNNLPDRSSPNSPHYMHSPIPHSPLSQSPMSHSPQPSSFQLPPGLSLSIPSSQPNFHLTPQSISNMSNTHLTPNLSPITPSEISGSDDGYHISPTSPHHSHTPFNNISPPHSQPQHGSWIFNQTHLNPNPSNYS